jgi:hypothetical protein
VRYEVRQPPEAVAALLRGWIKPEGVGSFLGFANGPVGRVSETNFKFTYRWPLFHNSFASVVEGTISEAPGGSQVTARFRLNRLGGVWMVAWLSFATLLSVPMGISALVNPSSWHPSPPPVLMTFFFPMFGVALVALGRAIARVQERSILSRLDQIFGATPNPSVSRT